MSRTCDVYLLCAAGASEPLMRPSIGVAVEHYIGRARDVVRRFEEHATGKGAALTRAWQERGIPFVVARVWEGVNSAHERRMKNTKPYWTMCPRCKVTRQDELRAWRREKMRAYRARRRVREAT